LGLPRGVYPERNRRTRRLNCIEFWAKKSVGGFELVKESFFIKTIFDIVFLWTKKKKITVK